METEVAAESSIRRSHMRRARPSSSLGDVARGLHRQASEALAQLGLPGLRAPALPSINDGRGGDDGSGKEPDEEGRCLSAIGSESTAGAQMAPVASVANAARPVMCACNPLPTISVR